MYNIGDDIVSYVLNKNTTNKIKEAIDYGKSYNTAEGSNLNITDSLKAPIKELHIYGESNQTQLTGSQLAVLPDVNPTDNNGVTWSCANGVVTAKGTPTNISTTSTFLAYYMPEGTAGVFTVSGSSNSVMVYVYILRADNTPEYIWDKSFTLDGTEQRVRLYMQVDPGNTVDTTIYPMLNVGATALPFEPYCGGIPSPNPEYPQEITSVGDSGSLTVTATGKNLFNPELLSYTNRYSVRDDGFVVFSNPSAYNQYPITAVSLPYGKYTVLVEIESISGNGAVYVGNNAADWSRPTKATRTVYLETDTVMICFSGKDGTAITARVGIYCKNASTDYEPYKSISANLASALPLKSVGDVKDEIVYNADGTAKVIKRNRLLNMTNVTFWTPKYIEDSDYQQFNVGMTVLSKTSDIVCTHFPYNANCTNGAELGIYIHNTSQIVVGVPKSVLIEYGYVGGTESTYLTALKSWLQAESDNGNPVTVIYQLATPEEIPLTAEEVEALKNLTMYNHTTNLYADGADMSVTYYNNKLCAIDARVSALEERVAVIETALISE